MKASIISIAFNNGDEIFQTIQSVTIQTYSEIEYIIVDGASTDKTLDIVYQNRGNITKIISEPDKGIYDAINKGIRAATGDIVGLIHAGDELYDSTVIEKIVNHFKNHDIDALYGHSKIYSEDCSKLVRINKSPEYKQSLFPLGWFPSHQSFYAKRELFEKFGYYNLKYKIAADYELVLRFLYFKNAKVKLLDEYIVKFKLGGASNKSLLNIIYQNRECVSAWRDNGLSMPYYTIFLKVLRKLKQFYLPNI